MSDSLFTTNSASNNSQILDRIKRSDGSIPYLRRANQVYSAAPIKAPAASSVNTSNSGNYAAGQVSNTGVQGVGNNTPFYVQGTFGFVASATTITIYWDGTHGSVPLVIKRVDGTNYSVPKGAIGILGLSPSTSYGFLPYNKLTNQDSLSFSVGDSGAPRYAFSPTCPAALIASANQNQKLSTSEAITSAFIYFTTPASGSIAGPGEYGTPSPYNQQRFAP